MTGEIENDIIIMFRLNGLVAQLVRARASHARGRRFEPYRVHHLCSTKKLQNTKSTRFSRSCAFLLPYFVVRVLQGRIDSNEKVNAEIENIKQCLSADSLDFSEYNDVTIRRLVEYIRVMKDNSIIIVLKGGMQIHENI